VGGGVGGWERWVVWEVGVGCGGLGVARWGVCVAGGGLGSHTGASVSDGG
jgi:hypothetical protein